MIQSQFDKTTLSDMAVSMKKEYLITSTKGDYVSSSIIGCNTRKYHGLLIAPQPQIDDNDHVLLSSLDETVILKNQSYQLGTHQYPNALYPRGFEFIEEFSATPAPKWVYKMDGIVLTKEILFSASDETMMIRYKVKDAPASLELQLKPFLAFRVSHHLNKANLALNKKINTIDNGVKIRMYSQYSDLYLQLSKNVDFIPVPDWYYNVEYLEEKNRGYDYKEDLYVPGYFSVKLNKGAEVVFMASLKENSPKTLKTRFTSELKKKKKLTTFDDCLQEAAQQFIIKKGRKTHVKAGYHWFGCWGRDTFISLPGLTLSTNQPELFKAVIHSSLPDLKEGLFPNVGNGKNAAYTSVDASLWFIWAVQQYALFTGSTALVWKEYGKQLSSILDYYKKGTLHNIKMQKDGLIYSGDTGLALTWMDCMVDGKPVTPRTGKCVEINALWFNAVCFCLEAALAANDKKFIAAWESYPEKIRNSFVTTFWDEDKKYLADYINDDYKDWSIRPNQIFAVSLPFSPLSRQASKVIVELIKNELLTARGLRTLSPKDANYHAHYAGDQKMRDMAYHQGTVWPWLTAHFAEACINEYGSEALSFIEDIYKGFETAIDEQCLYSINEVYDGDYPHKPGGAISQAWSIAELARLSEIIKKNKIKPLSAKLVKEATI